jgi:hypothetical protein
MKRSKLNLNFYRMITGGMGHLLPIGCVPVLPGDTFNHQTSALVRVSPLNTPVMHPVSVRIHHFFCPNRLVWDGWEEFITGGPDGMNTDTIPQVLTQATETNWLTYLTGAPAVADISVSALPLRAANLIYNEYYRDQDIIPERSTENRSVPRIAWEKDYFTTARPWTQKGPEVTLPVGSSAPIYGSDISGTAVEIGDDSQSGTYSLNNDPAQMTTAAGSYPDDVNLYADLSQASAININDFRAAFSVQRYQEARARYGSRFTEYLRYLGVRPSDARLQRPEYLGGGSCRLNFSEVLQTAPGATSGTTSDEGVGDLYGHGIAGCRGNTYRKFFEEHGYVITFLSVRPKSIYMNGIPREFLKLNKEDFYQKELVNLGQQEVYEAELVGENGRDVFGYQDRYHEYRSQPSQVSNEFRDTLSSWTLARDLAANPTLNEDFIECTPSQRIYQVESGVFDKLWIMANHNLVARRLVPRRANPRIL